MHKGFTLMELLTVIGITLMLAVLVTVGMDSRSGADLQNAAASVGGLADQARQLAISSRRETALALVTSGSDAYRALNLMYVDTSGNWRQGQWVRLPDKIVFDFKDSASTFFTNAVSNTTNVLSRGGGNLSPGTGYRAQGFRRDGILFGQTEPVTLRLREGTVNGDGSGLTYPEKAANRYYDVVLIPTGARAKYVRP